MTTIGLPAILAEHVTVPFVTALFVSFSVAASPAENGLPAFAGLGDVVNVTTFKISLVIT